MKTDVTVDRDELHAMETELAVLKARIAKLEAERTWQPIESAPEGEYILVTNGKLIDRSRFYYQAEIDSYHWEGLFYTLTHWMQLPRPPEYK